LSSITAAYTGFWRDQKLDGRLKAAHGEHEDTGFLPLRGRAASGGRCRSELSAMAAHAAVRTRAVTEGEKKRTAPRSALVLDLMGLQVQVGVV
jgi:hypothetical protein